MSQRPSLTCSPTKRKPVKSYASKVFQESSVGVVSSVAQTASVPRKIFKVLVFLFCLTGFLYQSGKYLLVVFEYPTTVDIDVVRPATYNIPAFTFCDNNGINRKLFCEKHPDRCEQPSEKLCEKYGGYCGENKTLVPKKEYYNLHGKMDIEEIMNFTVKIDSFVLEKSLRYSENITGPHVRVKDYQETYLCYSLNDRVNNPLYPLTFTQEKIVKVPVYQIKFKVKADETFLPGNRPGLLFALHSPFQAVNPFETGVFMRPGRTYMMYVTMEEEILEKRPYDTDCINYTEVWEKNGRTGPRYQDMCKYDCVSDISMQCYNCVLAIFLYPRPEKLCDLSDRDISSCPENVHKLIDECDEKCKDDCRQTKYRYTVQERFKGHFDENGDTIPEIDDIIDVEIYLDGDELIVLKHSPKYMIVEVFSSIGGFVGIWLGMSLLDVADIMEGFFRIFRYAFKKRT